jgi:hypothetical protein
MGSFTGACAEEFGSFRMSFSKSTAQTVLSPLYCDFASARGTLWDVLTSGSEPWRCLAFPRRRFPGVRLRIHRHRAGPSGWRSSSPTFYLPVKEFTGNSRRPQSAANAGANEALLSSWDEDVVVNPGPPLGLQCPCVSVIPDQRSRLAAGCY